MARRPNKSREVLLNTVAAGLYQDAAPLIGAIMQESRFVFAWRPARAAVIRVLADGADDGRVWMSRDEFERWFIDQTAAARKRRDGSKPLEAVGISSYVKLQVLQGKRAITKVQALAMAHFAHYRPLPIPPDNSDAFATWITDNFGAVDPITQWLGLRTNHMADLMRGFSIDKGQRRPKAPDVTLIRAMDWVLTMGPFCPYGTRPSLAFFPKGESACSE